MHQQIYYAACLAAARFKTLFPHPCIIKRPTNSRITWVTLCCLAGVSLVKKGNDYLWYGPSTLSDRSILANYYRNWKKLDDKQKQLESGKII